MMELQIQMTLSERITAIKERFKLNNNELGKIAGVSGQSIINIEAGITKNPKSSLLGNISSKLGVSLKWLMDDEGGMLDIDHIKPYGESVGTESNLIFLTHRQHMSFREFPYVSIRARASFVEMLDDEDYRKLETYPVYYADDKKYDKSVVIEINGDSMEPTYLSGTKVLISQVSLDKWPYVSGPVVVNYEGSVVFKRIKKNFYKDKTVVLHSDNPMGGDLEIEVKSIRSIWKAERIVDSRAV
jgi:phage repressor protein C with HTH and peptisase S24 domain